MIHPKGLGDLVKTSTGVREETVRHPQGLGNLSLQSKIDLYFLRKQIYFTCWISREPSVLVQPG